MKFGPIDVTDAAGAILAHSLPVGQQKFKKGRVLSGTDVEALRAAGLATVIAARLEPDDVGEDEAANLLAAAVAGEGVEATAAFTGRCNLFSTRAGLLVVDQALLDQVNLVHEDLTVATLEPFSVVDPKQMVATIKIIPFAVAGAVLDQCLTAARNQGPIIRVIELRRKRVGFIQTRLPGDKDSVLEKATRVLAGRLSLLGAEITQELRCTHEEPAVRAAIEQLLAGGAELILIAGASAIVDRRDVIPAAIVSAGGYIEHYGMPVDPGNLLLLGYHCDTPVLGLPGCARSPKYNGLDKVLVRLAAGLRMNAQDIMRMGAGGLLKETASRGVPRAENTPQPAKPERAPARAPMRAAPMRAAPKIAALVLAGGQSRRMGPVNKLLAAVDGKLMVARAVEVVAASQVERIIVVTGFERERIEQALKSYRVDFVHNPAYAEGISTALRAGLAALPDDLDGVLVCLGDMPQVSTAHINRLIAAFDPVEGRAICVPTHHGKRGNPVLWAKRFFSEMREVAGDVGAKHLLGEHDTLVCEVEMSDRGVLVDIDSPQALAALTSDQA